MTTPRKDSAGGVAPGKGRTVVTINTGLANAARIYTSSGATDGVRTGKPHDQSTSASAPIFLPGGAGGPMFGDTNYGRDFLTFTDTKAIERGYKKGFSPGFGEKETGFRFGN
jgi:hypothetical protein